MRLGFFVFLFLTAWNAEAQFDQNHTKWTQVLSQFSSKKDVQVLLNYKKLQQEPEKLHAYLKDLEQVTDLQFKSFSTSERLAFWINAYNAYTVKIILENYPVSSIRKIKSGFFSSGPWKKKFIPLFGKKISLDHIEHGIIRKDFHEPRIHFAVNCASMSCPSLSQKAYTGALLEKQLQEASQAFLKNTSKNILKGETLFLSQIFKWYGEDFKTKYGSFQNYVVQELQLPQKNYSIQYLPYSWELNEVKN